MISKTFQISLLAAIAVYFFLLVLLLKNKKLLLKYSLLWIFAGVLMLVMALFPSLLGRLSVLVGIYDPVNALFAILFFCVIILLVSLTSIVSTQNEKLKRLIQVQAILEEEIRTLKREAEK